MDEAWVKFTEKHPLAKFSYYLNGRVLGLKEIENEILDNLDNAFVDDVSYHEEISRAELLIWLWTLGSYEVIRTMHQAKSCFSERVQEELFVLKKRLSVVRMPNAKMEKVGKKIPVNSSRSASGIDVQGRDLRVGEPNNDVSARSLIDMIRSFFESLKSVDVIACHESSYERKS